MKSLFSNLFQKNKDKNKEAPKKESFAARYHRFRLFLNAHIEAYSSIINFEERLADDLPVGLPFIRTTLARLTVSTAKCIIQLNALSDNAYERLQEPFTALRANLQKILATGIETLSGPFVVPLQNIGEEHRQIISNNLLKIKSIKDAYPELVPQGFVVTATAWQEYLNNQNLQEEVDRLVLIAQSDPAAYGEAGATVQEHLLAHFPLPQNIVEQVEQAAAPLLSSLQKEGYSLLVRCFPVNPEHGALLMPEQVIHSPVESMEPIITSLHKAMVMAYRPRALIYRLKLGLRSRSMPFCVVFSVIPTKQTRGSAYLNLDPASEGEVTIHIRRKNPTDDSAQHNDESVYTAEWEKSLKAHCLKALKCLEDAPVHGNRHEIYWLNSDGYEFLVLGATALPDPQPEETDHIKSCACTTPKFCGGKGTYPGAIVGKPILVRNFADAIRFPIGSILVLEFASPRWTFLLDFASAAIVQEGLEHAMFARVARRNGRPTVLNMPEALSIAEAGQDICLEVSTTKAPCVYEATEQEIKALQASQSYNTGHTWYANSLIASMVKELAPLVALLSFADADDPDFRAENCESFHDFITYSHDHAVKAVFSHVTSSKSAEAPAKQLVCNVPKQFWIINLNDGFYENSPGPTVDIENIASQPMRALWEGFVEKPWDGPPAINAKGFLSVLFEATQNPNLDPASQSTHYTEKNVFLISKQFCSMRCRFGFHFLSLDCLIGDRDKERFIIFQFKGGAANIARRVRRVQFIAELLAQFDMNTELLGDTLTARMEQGSEEDFIKVLKVIGYLVMHTRQLDMIMSDERELAKRRADMLKDMHSLADRPHTPLP